MSHSEPIDLSSITNSPGMDGAGTKGVPSAESGVAGRCAAAAGVPYPPIAVGAPQVVAAGAGEGEEEIGATDSASSDFSDAAVASSAGSRP